MLHTHQRHVQSAARSRGVTNDTAPQKLFISCILLIFLTLPPFAAAQAPAPLPEPPDFKSPQVVFQTRGHSAPVRTLLFTPDGTRLLSAGWDKIVNIWDLKLTPPSRVGTLRPPIRGGLRGLIYAMALSPRPDAQGQRLLAVAGYGVLSQIGEILVFAYPGSSNETNGEVLFQLPDNSGNQPKDGHTNTVMALAFSPDGRFLASASMDATVRVWDIQRRESVAVLRGHEGPVNALAFDSRGRHIASGGNDGIIRLWDPDNPGAPIAQVDKRLAKDPQGQPVDDTGRTILNLASSPDGKYLVAGRENGILSRYSLPALDNEYTFPVAKPGLPIEAIAYSNDGTRLATSILAERQGNNQLPSPNCTVSLWSMPDGRPFRDVLKTSHLSYALAFSPDDRTLAVAGGNEQPIHLIDLTKPQAEPIAVLKGEGTSIWEVAFTPDSRSVAFGRKTPGETPVEPELEAFDLLDCRFSNIPRDQLRGPLTQYQGWTVEPLEPYSLQVRNPAGQPAAKISLDQNEDRRWWSWSFIPPNPEAGHPRLMLAVGCDAGHILIFDPATGQKTRLFRGHAGHVYSLAPSPDGRWLASGSLDQTVRVWTLAGCDQRPPLGASLQLQPDGTALVARVDPGGFADNVGIKQGDVVDRVFFGAQPFPPREVIGRQNLDEREPGKTIAFEIRGQIFTRGTSRSDRPAFNLFSTLNRQWILWNPKGFYETSPTGDRLHLGWHQNRGSIQALQSASFSPSDSFEKDLRRRDFLRALFETASEAKALEIIPRELQRTEDKVAQNISHLPKILIDAPKFEPHRPLLINSRSVQVRLRVQPGVDPDTRANFDIQRIEIQLGGQKIPNAKKEFDPPTRVPIEHSTTIDLYPGTSVLSLRAFDSEGRSTSANVELIVKFPIDQPVRKPRFFALSIGVEETRDGREIQYATRDATALGDFLVDPKLGPPRFETPERVLLNGQDVTTKSMEEALKNLKARAVRGDLQQGDTAVVWLETHLLAMQDKRVLLAADTRGGTNPDPSLDAALLSDTLAYLTERGCTTLLLLDVNHQTTHQPPDAVNELARDLAKRGVITFVASTSDASRRLAVARHGAFARSLLDVPARRIDRNVPLSLSELREIVTRQVLELTSRGQYAEILIPETVSPNQPILQPPLQADETNKAPTP